MKQMSVGWLLLALLRVIEAGYGMMLAYVCKYLESDGRCRSDHGGVLVLSRSLNDVPEELVVHYADLFPELCLESTDELIRVSPSGRSLKILFNDFLSDI